MKKIALTGNIGCGKSYVASYISTYGVFVMDCDKIAAKVRQEHADALSHVLGMDVRDTTALSNVVFSNKTALEALENALYPYIIEELEMQFALHTRDALVVVEVPLLYEKGWDTLFDEVWVVACDSTLAKQRTRMQRGVSEADFERRCAQQWPLADKKMRADHIIYNNVDSDIEGVVRTLLKKEGV